MDSGGAARDGETEMDKIVAKVTAQKTDTLKEMAASLYVDMREGADIVLSAVLDALMARMPEADFVAFCEKLEA